MGYPHGVREQTYIRIERVLFVNFQLGGKREKLKRKGTSSFFSEHSRSILNNMSHTVIQSFVSSQIELVISISKLCAVDGDSVERVFRYTHVFIGLVYKLILTEAM